VSHRPHPLWAAVAVRNRGHRRVTTLTWAAAIASLLGTFAVAEVARAATTTASSPPASSTKVAVPKPAGSATTVVPLHLPARRHRVSATASASPSATPTETPSSRAVPTPKRTHRHVTPAAAPSHTVQAPTTPPAPPTTPPVVVSSGS
jgi:hypothetical protein